VGGEASGVQQHPHGDGGILSKMVKELLGMEWDANIDITGHAREPSMDFNARSWSIVWS